MKSLKYSYERLQTFCNENSIELCRDYSQELVKRETKIEGKCRNEECNDMFNKSFQELIENKNFYCKKCLNKLSDKKRKETCLEKYGVENAMSNESVQNKIKLTNLQKYGVEYTFQSEQYKIKYKSTVLKKFGVENVSQNEDIKKKKIKTCLENYGVEHPSQSNKIKQKKIETSLKNYGVEYPIQDPNVLDKNIKSCYRTKQYIFPSGNIILTQGYEHLALDELINKEQIDEKNIIMGAKNVPTIWYFGNDCKNHRHYVDIFIPTQNRCIEVKSTWTAKHNEHNIYLKQKAAKLLGYNYEIWIYNEKEEKINCYE